MVPKNDEPMQARETGPERKRKRLRRIKTLEEGGVPAQKARGWKIEGHKRRVTEEGFGRFHGAERIMAHRQKERMLEDRGKLCREKTETCPVNTNLCTEKTFHNRKNGSFQGLRVPACSYHWRCVYRVSRHIPLLAAAAHP